MTINCPKWDSCNAPVCPLDPNWQAQKHLAGEPVCLWLRESVKNDGERVLRHSLTEINVEKVIAVKEILYARGGELKFRLERASLSGSKANAMNRARECLL